ncbi:MAG: hypothetical protein CFH31_00990, partial [Alphaproteobacteria bacterium MarineAlpha9_Bin1]
ILIRLINSHTLKIFNMADQILNK